MAANLPPLPPFKMGQKATAPPWFERQMMVLDAFFARIIAEPKPLWKVLVIWVVSIAFRLLFWLGRVFPWFYRPIVWVCRGVNRYLDRRRRTKFDTVRTLALRRIFSLHYHPKANFHLSYLLLNLLFLWLIPPTLFDALYAYGTYRVVPNVVVSQTYPQASGSILRMPTYSIHGDEELPDGSRQEIYYELGFSLWYWVWYQEFIYGHISQFDRCTFEVYGWTIRFPKLLRFGGQVYAVNPWIVGSQCIKPTIVPPNMTKPE